MVIYRMFVGRPFKSIPIEIIRNSNVHLQDVLYISILYFYRQNIIKYWTMKYLFLHDCKKTRYPGMVSLVIYNWVSDCLLFIVSIKWSTYRMNVLRTYISGRPEDLLNWTYPKSPTMIILTLNGLQNVLYYLCMLWTS